MAPATPRLPASIGDRLLTAAMVGGLLALLLVVAVGL